MKSIGLIALVLSVAFSAPAAKAEVLHCYLGVGSNEAPSCAAKPAELDFGTAASTVRAYDVPDFRLELRPSALVRGAYDSALISTRPEGTQTFLYETMIATKQGLQFITDPHSPLSDVKYDQGPGTSFYVRAGAPDFSHPALLKRANATLAFIDTVDTGATELFVGIAMLKAIVCSKGTAQNEAAWRQFVATFDRQCIQ
jgi:hypothetical protein